MLHKYSQPSLNTLLKHLLHQLQPQVFLLISIWQLSAILLPTSSPLKLCQVGWGQMHIFRFLQKYLIGFKLRLWLGHSRTFTELSISHSCCVLRVIVLLEGEPSVQFEVLNALDWVFIKAISIFWCIELFFYSESFLCHWKTAPQHEAATSTLYFWDGTLQVMSRAGFLQTWCLELRFIRPENIVSHSLRVLKVLSCKFQVCFHASSLRRGLSLATPP